MVTVIQSQIRCVFNWSNSRSNNSGKPDGNHATFGVTLFHGKKSVGKGTTQLRPRVGRKKRSVGFLRISHHQERNIFSLPSFVYIKYIVFILSHGKFEINNFLILLLFIYIIFQAFFRNLFLSLLNFLLSFVENNERM